MIDRELKDRLDNLQGQIHALETLVLDALLIVDATLRDFSPELAKMLNADTRKLSPAERLSVYGWKLERYRDAFRRLAKHQRPQARKAARRS